MLENDEFLNYLEYLEYWRKPEYSKYLIYPNCLHVLSLLKEPRFRQEITRADLAKMFMDDFYMKWLDPKPEQQEQATSDDPELKQENNNEKPEDQAGKVNGVKEEI